MVEIAFAEIYPDPSPRSLGLVEILDDALQVGRDLITTNTWAGEDRPPRQ